MLNLKLIFVTIICIYPISMYSYSLFLGGLS